MTQKSDFTPEAWEQLKAGPLAAGLYVIIASPSLLGMFSEMGAMAKGMQVAAAQAGSGSLLAELLAELDAKTQQNMLGAMKPKMGTSQPDSMAELLVHIEAAGAAIAGADAEDATAYRGLVTAVAQGVAAASKDEGVAVGPKEAAALAQIASAIGAA